MTIQTTGLVAAADHDCGAMTARELLHRPGSLLVTRPPRAAARPAPGQPGAASDYVAPWPEVFIAVLDDGRVLALNGHVDLGTGVRTALAQIVAEELDVAMERVRMILGHTEAVPNQGPTIASTTIQITATPLRQAAAQARAFLVSQAAQQLGLDVAGLSVRDGAILHNGEPRIHYADLVKGGYVELLLDDQVACKPPHTYRIVGRDVPRVDIPAKAAGTAVYVHDVRVPGMLHGRVVRPPYAGRDCGAFVGRSLRAVDDRAAAALPGYVATVVIGDFVGVVAEREEFAERAARLLRLAWDEPPSLPDLRNGAGLAAALRAIPGTRRPLSQSGDVDAALMMCAQPLRRTYVWPYQMHASIGPSCAVADFRDDTLTVWSGTQNPHMHRLDLARLLDLDEGRVSVLRHEAAGCYGRNGADDVGADAALLSRAVGRPVRVQLSRDQEHAWEPKGAAQLVEVMGGLDADGGLAACEFLTRYPSNDAPTLALLLTGKLGNGPRQLEMGDRTAVPPYAYPNVRVACDDVPAVVRAAWLRGVSALPNAFAHECYIDELAEMAGEDPLAFRLRYLPDSRARDLLQALAQRAGWIPRRGARRRTSADGRLCYGQGIAYARYVHSRFPGFGAAWAAWVAEVEVDTVTGAVRVTRVVVGQDAGMMVNPAGVRHQLHGNVIQTVSRTLKEEVAFDERGVASREWGAYPILRFDEVPAIEVLLMPRQDEPPLGAGESASVPGAAAIANALFDATGVRYTAPPFTPATIRGGFLAACV
jgi:CO/xanthine dehydrogenase Mo-binding subunit